MGSVSTNLHKQIMLDHGHGDVRLWRNNTGMGWAGDAQRLSGGCVLIRNARPLHAGLYTGSGDLIGIRRVLIRPEHIGRSIGVFVNMEAKTGRGRLTEDQENFNKVVREMGGIAGEVRSTEDAAAILAFE